MGRMKAVLALFILILVTSIAWATESAPPANPLDLHPDTEPGSLKFQRYQLLKIPLSPARDGQKNLQIFGNYWQIRSSFTLEKSIIKDFYLKMAQSQGEVLNNSYANDLYFLINQPDGPLHVKLHIQSSSYNLQMVREANCPEKIVFGNGYYAHVDSESERAKPKPPLVTDFPNTEYNFVTYNDYNTLLLDYKIDGKRNTEPVAGRYWHKIVDLVNRPDRPWQWVSTEELTEVWRQAVIAAGGEVLTPGERGVLFHISSPTEGEIWGNMWPQDGRYNIKILQEETMEQILVFDADSMMAQLDALGSLTLNGIFFDTAKATLQPKSEEALNAALKLMTDYPDLVLEVGGHTDNVGSIQDNESLSQRRAASVQNWLVEKGIAAERLEAKGYGEAWPVEENETDAGRAANRRVELKKLAGGKVREVMSLIKPYPGSIDIGHDEKQAEYKLQIYERDAAGKIQERQIIGSGFRQFYQVYDAAGEPDEQLSGIQIRHNYIQAVEEFGGTILAEDSHGLYFRLDNLDGSQTFVSLWAPGSKYQISAVTVYP